MGACKEAGNVAPKVELAIVTVDDEMEVDMLGEKRVGTTHGMELFQCRLHLVVILEVERDRDRTCVCAWKAVSAGGGSCASRHLFLQHTPVLIDKAVEHLQTLDGDECGDSDVFRVEIAVCHCIVVGNDPCRLERVLEELGIEQVVRGREERMV